MSTIIKRLSQNGQEFVPITLAEAVVVNTNAISGYQPKEITTLDKVLDKLGLSISQFLTALAGKQDALKEGAGIKIAEDGTISCTIENYSLYQVLSRDQWYGTTPEGGEFIPGLKDSPSAQYLNKIYLAPTSDVNGNSFTEYICHEVPSTDPEAGVQYAWEQLGAVQTQVDLSGYVTIDSFNQFKASTITATDVKTSSGAQVVVSYDIPVTLYDSAVETNADDQIVTPEP